MQASGVSTQPIEDFNTLTEAVKGSGSSIDSFVTNAIAQLGQFEGAASRAGTILRSSTRFNDQGGAERATQTEQLQNAFQVQKLVNSELDNTVSSTAALSAQYDVLSSGFTKAADSQKVLTAGLKLVGIGEAGGTSAPVSATTRLLTSTMNAYEQTADQAAETAGVLNNIVESGLTTIPELLDLGATAKQASAAGVSLKDLGASVAVLTTQGVNTAESLTGLSRVTGSILNKTPQAQEALDKLSISGQKIRFDKAEVQSKGLVQSLIDINKAAGGSAQKLSEIFPEEVAFRTVLTLLAQSGEKLKGIREGFEGAGAQSLDEVFKIASEDRISRMEKIANRFQEAIIQVAASLAPVLEPGLNALEAIGGAFNSLPDSVKQGIGAYISAQVQFRAGSAAAGVLVDTLKTLATNYLITRGASLLLTGQLGKEVGILKDLFTQRKGLLAVGLQVFGIDQRWRLTSEQATEALTKQSAAAQLLTNARSKLSEVVGRNVQSFQQQRLPGQTIEQLKQTGGAVGSQARDAVTAGITAATNEGTRKAAIAASEDLWKSAKERATSAAQEISRSAETIGTGLGQAAGIIPSPQILGPDGKPLSSGGIQSVKSEFRRIGGVVGEAAQTTFTGLKDQFGKPLPIPQIDVAGVGEKAKEVGEVIAANIANPDAIKRQMAQVSQAVVGEIDQLKTRTVAEQEAMSADARAQKTTTELIERDTEVRKKSNQSRADRAELLKLEADAQNKVAQSAEISQRIEEKSVQLAQQQSQATELFLSDTATREEKQKALNETLKQEQSLEREQTRLQTVQAEAENLTAQITEARAKATESSTASLQTRIAAEQRLEPVARAMVAADTSATAAAQAKQAATIAAAEATQLEAALGIQDERAIASRTRARVLGTQATQLETVATQRATTANALYRTEARASELAEKGLAEARIFGRTVTYSLTGPLAGINKLLASEITLKGAATTATGIYATAQSGLGKVTGAVGSLLRADLSKLKPLLDGIGKAGSTGFGAIGGGIKTLMAPLGLVGPLLIPLSLGLVAFREDIWGVGAAAREASKGFDEFQQKQAELERQLQGQEGLSQLREKTKALINDTSYVSEATKRATQAGETVQRGFSEKAFSIPGETVSGLSGAIGGLFGGVGEKLNNAVNQELTQADPAAEKLKPFRSELDQLRESGAITSGQFALLSKSLNDVGQAGDINKEKLKDFKGQLDAVMQGAGGIEKGVTEQIGGRILEAVKSAPGGILDVLGNVLAIPAAVVEQGNKLGDKGIGGASKDLLSGQAFNEVKSAREADRLIRPMSEVGIAIEGVGNASIATQEAIGKYNRGLALTADVTAKIRQGTRLTATDLEGENKAFKNRSELNQGQISGLNEQIKKYEEVAAKIKDPEIKASFEGRVDALRTEVGLLEKRNEKLKSANEFLNKYQTETLPNLIQALNESSDPTKSLQQAGETFRQQYQTDAQGKTTPFIKDIATLRQEAQRYQVQITDALETGEFDTKIEAAYGVKITPGQAEEEAARRLQEVRDGQIKYLENGVEKSGFRLSTSDRKVLTQQIAELENQGLKREEANANLGLERTKNLQRSQVLGAAETEDEIAKIQKENLNRQLQQKENEIAAYQKAGFRTVDLENQAAQLRNQIRTAEIEESDRLRQRSLDRRLKDLDLEAERIKTRSARRTATGEEAEEGLANVQAQQAQLRLDQLKAERAKRAKPDPELNNQIAQAEEQIAQSEAQRDEQRRQRRIKRRETDAQLEQDRLKVSVAFRTKTQDEAERQSAQIEQQSAKARLADLEELYKRSGSRDVDLARDISKQRLEIERMAADGIEKERQRLIRSRDGELEVDKAQLGARIANRTATQEEAERQSTQIEKQAAQNRIKDLEEIYNKSGRRDIGLGQDLAKARAEAERLSGEAIEKERQRQISRRNTGFEIEEAQVRLSLSNRLVSQREAEQQSDEIQISSAQARLADMEELYKRSGSRDADLANDISKARLEIEQKTAEAINKEREFQFAQNQQRIKNEVQAETLVRQQQLNQGQIQQKDLEIRNKYLDDARNLFNAQNQAVEAQVQNVAKLTSDSVTRAGIERKLAEDRLNSLAGQQQFERLSIENQKTIIQITSDREVAQARLQQLENRRDQQLTQNELAKAQRERRPEEEIRTIELQLQGLEQQNLLIDQQVDQAEQSRQQQLDSLNNQRKQLDLTQATARENAQIEIAQARINQYQAALAQATERVSLAEQARQQQMQQAQKFNDAIGKGLEQQLGYLEAQAKAVNARNEFATGELSLAAELTKNDVERQNIAKSIADIKLNSTQQQIQYERTVLELNQQQKQLQIESEKIANRVGQSQNLAETAKARAELAKLMASPTASREEIFAAQLQLRAEQQEGAGLRFQEAMLGQQQQLTAYTQQQERTALEYQSQLKIDQARAEQIRALPEKQQEVAAAGLKNELIARGRSVGMAGYELPDVNAARQNMQALIQEFQIPSLETPVELQPQRSQTYIEEQMRQLEPVRAEFNQLRESFSPTNSMEALSRRVGELQQTYTQQQTPQATVLMQGRPIIEKVVIENVSTSIQNSQQPGQDIEGVVFQTISNLTDRLQREFS
jgi:hypothetical protein